MGNISVWELGANLVSRNMFKVNERSTEQWAGAKFLSWVDSHIQNEYMNMYC